MVAVQEVAVVEGFIVEVASEAEVFIQEAACTMEVIGEEAEGFFITRMVDEPCKNILLH